MTIIINLGLEGESKMSKMDLILNEIKEIKTDVKEIKDRIDVIESLPIIQQELKNK